VLPTRVILTLMLYISLRLVESSVGNRQSDLEKKWDRSLVSVCSWFS